MKRLLVIASLVSLAGCGHLTRPSTQYALLDESTIVDVLDHTAEQGSLILTEQGQWALLDPKKISPRRGELLLVTQPQKPDAPPQLFAIVSTHDWGAMLQRLSRSTFEPTPSYIITPIEPEMLDLDEHGAKLCLAQDDCKTKLNQHLHYKLHPEDLTLLSELGPREDRYLLPIRPSWRTPSGPSLLIPTNALEEQSFIASIDRRCDDTSVDALRLPEHVEILRHDPPETKLSTHPLHVEQLAITQHADVLITCEESGRIELATPSLARPWLPSRHPELGSPGPALLGAAPLILDLEQMNAGDAGLIVRGAGAVARGFYTRAGVLFERALAGDDTFSAQRDALALALAQIIALDAPEQAARIAYMATRQAWRRDEVLGQNMVMIAVWNALGQRSAVQRIESSLPERVQRQPEAALLGWTTWRGLSQEIERGNLRTLTEIKSAARSFPESAQSTPAWNLMLGASLLLSDSPPRGEQLDTLLDALSMQAKQLDVEDAILTLTTAEHGSGGCKERTEADLCLIDVYGKRLLSRGYGEARRSRIASNSRSSWRRYDRARRHVQPQRSPRSTARTSGKVVRSITTPSSSSTPM